MQHHTKYTVDRGQHIEPTQLGNLGPGSLFSDLRVDLTDSNLYMMTDETVIGKPDDTIYHLTVNMNSLKTLLMSTRVVVQPLGGEVRVLIN